MSPRSAVSLAFVLTAPLIFFTACNQAPSPPADAAGNNGAADPKKADPEKAAFRAEQAKLAAGSVSIFIDPGNQGEAVKYYQRISQKLSLPLLDGNGNVLAGSDLNALVAYAGYEGLQAQDFESIESFALMPKNDSAFATLAGRVADPATFKAKRSLADFGNDNVLVSRFFAPKIVDYTQIEAPTNNAHYTPGWRKLVRLKPLANSKASGAGVDTLYILFNFVKQDVTLDPFAGNSSKNNQVIIVPTSFQKGTEDSAFFLVYGEAPANKLVFALGNVAFDLPGPKDYFVPRSCAQCHGHDGRTGNSSPAPADGIYRQARVNYLDTDQWHDAMAFDFPQLADKPWGVIFDGGRDTTATNYHTAMEVMRKLNSGAQAQDATVDGSDFKFQAADKWLSLHKTQDGPVQFTDRAIGTTLWDATNGDEKELLGLLNHYCFRCHSSVRYNVFDKDGVDAASAGFESRLNADPKALRYMPQGRKLPVASKDRIIDLVKKLFP
jgi:hypothetical protein